MFGVAVSQGWAVGLAAVETYRLPWAMRCFGPCKVFPAVTAQPSSTSHSIVLASQPLNRHWPRERNLQSLLWLEPSASTTSLEFVRAGLEGRIVGYREISHATAPLLTAKTSTSLSRAPAAGSNFVRGRSGFVPFVPGGLEEEVLKEPSGEEEDAADGLGQEVKGMEDVLETGSGEFFPPVVA